MRASTILTSLVFAHSLACTIYEVPDETSSEGSSGGITAGSSSGDVSSETGATSSGADTSTGGEDPTTTSAGSTTTTGVDTTSTQTSNATSAGSDGTTGDPAACDFAKSIQPIFNANCGCHSGVMAALGLVLTEGQAYANLVDVDSVQQPGTPRVAPGNPAGSWLVTKLKPNPPQGKQMPQGGMLAPNQIDLIETWIAAGAPNGSFDCGDNSGGTTGGEPDAGSVEIDHPGPVYVDVGETVDLDAIVYDMEGKPVMDAPVKWIASDEATVFVDGKGTVLGIKAGTAQVTAEVDGVSSKPVTVEVQVSDPPPATFADTLNMLKSNCGCHAGAMPPQGLAFDGDPATVHANLVLAPATQDPASYRVIADAPEQSYLFQKLTRSTPKAGEQMPKGKAPLDAEKVVILLRWIAGGAQP